MPKYQIGDIKCSALSAPDGKFQARVRVVGIKLDPPSITDYVYESSQVFDTEDAALHHATDHANRHFPPK